LIEAYDAPYVVSGAPTDHLQLRAPRDLLAVGELVGFDADWLGAGLDEWGRLAALNRKRLAGEQPDAGVWLGPDEGEGWS
jgi:ribonuclease P/MRP protein subunit RPP1